ncbi:glycerol-3-phosphate O-acyltransferase [Dacryopinax primogenitus]|uniref:Glycerol-3-phosphate O-acyltransferase n=1 Tax=Dacryopinax primogenitus (strain DJM 731) TaxID=1858805 RepID=M5FYT0_DACPD|nr:glycerol-3-phosphate O-acyltransferase [Dacryopinax primogenitus]EJT96657.1 glycerol-3-phosphate O-acyltransferase [Dacryopinax primogenitus]
MGISFEPPGKEPSISHQAMSHRSNFAYDAVILFWRMVLNLFFREIRPRGAWNIPRSGPVIFVAAPHHNQFLDPLIVASETFRETGRRIGYLIAASSMKLAVIGTCAKWMAAIPVERAGDSKKDGTGLIMLHPEDSTLVLGTGTKFTAELGPKAQILLPKSTSHAIAEVKEVLSDTEVRIKEFKIGDGTKGTRRVREKMEEVKAAGKEGFDWKIVPHLDQKEVYMHVYERLKEGECIGIFPEGGSHDRTDLLPLKAGVSIMALGAMASDNNVRVRIVPVGLSYFHPHRFRSRAVIEFGRAFEVPTDLVEMFQSGGDGKRTAVSKLLDLIYDGLKTVTVRAPDYDTLMLIQASRRLYKTPGQHLTLSQVVELNKRFIEGYLHFQNEPRVQALKHRVEQYNRALRNLGLRDHQVETATRHDWKTAVLLVYRTGLLMAWATFALPGVILNAPIFLTAAYISKQKAKSALAASTVKLAARDVIGTWKVLVSLLLTPLLYITYAVIATYISHQCRLSLKYQLATPVAVMVALPCIAYSALKFGEAGMDVLKSLPPLILSFLPGQQKRLNRLKAMRADLSNEVSDAINEFGPQLYEDFDARRVHVAATGGPPSSDAALGIWRRKSALGGADAQGNLLIHPMTWLDERIFGWSRSANHGTNAWGHHPSDISRITSPVPSDGEESDGEASDGRDDAVAASVEDLHGRATRIYTSLVSRPRMPLDYDIAATPSSHNSP